MLQSDALLLEHLNTLVVRVDSEGYIDYVNQSVKQTLGIESNRIVGNRWIRFAGSNRDELKHSMEQARKELKLHPGLNSFSFERRIKTANGKYKWILWNNSRMENGSIVGVGHDITERKAAEERMVESHLQLRLKNEEIQGSIDYAARIQEAILQEVSVLKHQFADAFILFQPRDTVSGDVYFFHEKNNKIFVLCGDCTGHGVPGALMSVLAHSVIRDSVVNRTEEDPASLLYAIDEALIEALSKKSGTAINDGMDLGIAVFDKNSKILEFAGAFRPLLLVRDQEVSELNASRYPLGFYQDVKKVFTTYKIQAQTGDQFFMFSDGFIDQFGGEYNKKLNKKRFRELLLSAAEMESDEQEAFLAWSLRNWMQQEEQTDDVLVIGAKIG